MSAIGILILILEIAFAIHAIKRDEWNWVFLIVFIPFIGCLLYFFFAIIPESRDANNSRHSSLSYRKGLESNRKLKKKLQAVNSNSSVGNYIGLAEELMSNGKTDDAIALYDKSLSGQYYGNPNLMLGLAKAYFKRHRFGETRDILDSLIKLNPDFRSLDGHLLYARTQEELENYTQAREEYEALIKYSSDVEVLCAYAVFLKKRGEDDSAKKYFKQILADVEKLSKEHKESKRKWVSVAKMELLNW